MFCVPTRKTRRFIGSFTRGMEFPTAFLRVMTDHQIRSGKVSLTGQLEICTLSLDSRTETTISNAVLLYASGFISDVNGEVVPCLSGFFQFTNPVGVQLIGGRLLSARFVFAEFEIEAFDDVFIVRNSDPRWMFPPWTDCITEPTDAPQALTVSQNVEETPEESTSELIDETDELHPAADDVVEHFRFGSCRVLRIDGGDILEVVTPSKNKARLSMSVLRFEFVGTDENGLRHFKARPNRER